MRMKDILIDCKGDLKLAQKVIDGKTTIEQVRKTHQQGGDKK